MLTLSACAIALAAFVGWQRAHAKAAALTIRSIAVLPLQNLSGDAAQEYFADGMTEELITEVSRIQSLKVISRTSVMEYKGTKKHLPQIARELGADGIVEGSVVREGDQVRVTVQLLDGRDDRHLWSEEYQRPLRGILDLQREIAHAIAQHVSAQITAEQQVRFRSARAVDPEAYEAYLRGRYYLYNQSSMRQPLEAAKRYFEASIQKDPRVALPYAGLADVSLNMAFYRRVSPEHAYQSARQALGKALELESGLSEAHSTLASLSWRYEWDWAAADREFNYAIALDPNYDCVRADHANYLAWCGRRAEALAEVTKGRELNPGSSYNCVESSVYFQLGDYPNLIDASRRGVLSDPTDWLAHYFLGVGYEGSGKRAEAVPEFEKAVGMSGGDQDARAALAHAYAVLGKRAEAEKILRDLIRESKDGYVSPYMVAVIHAGLGDKDKAFAFLDKAVQERSLDIVWNLKIDPRVDSLRSDARFQTIWRRVGFPQ